LKTFQKGHGFRINNYFLAGTKVLKTDVVEDKAHNLFTKLSVHQSCNKLTNQLW